MALHPWNYISLCSGAGGLELGLRIANPAARCVAYCEGEAYAASLIVSRMEEGNLDKAPIWSDIRTFDGRAWRGIVEAVVGGIPCQPASVAGKRGGAADERWLWPHAMRIVEEVRPQLCFFENVPGLISGKLLDAFREGVAGPLEEMGYRTAGGLFTAGEVGAGHRRQRLFLLAHRGSQRRPEDAGGPPSHEEEDGRTGRHLRQPDSHHVPDRVCEGLGLFPPGPEELGQWEEVLSLRPDLGPALLRVAPGMATELVKPRLRAIGNGVVPLVAALAWRTLANALGLNADISEEISC